MERPIGPTPETMRKGRFGTALTGTLVAALVALTAFTGLSSTAIAQQQGVPPTAGITVIGYGSASVPAETATLQMVISTSNYGSPTVLQPGATPGAQEREDIQPTLDALMAAGVAEDQIDVLISPVQTSYYGPAGPAVARIDVSLDAPTPERIRELVDAATVGAAGERLVLGQVGVGYGVADCAGVDRQAREAALADAGRRGDVQAELLGVTLGDVVSASDLPLNPYTSISPYFGFALSQLPCSPDLPSLTDGVSILSPPYDPTAEAVVEVYAQVTVTYAITSDATATPAA